MAGNSAYPTGVDAWATNKAFGTSMSDHPQHHNDLADSVNKIEAELGADPSGSFSTVVARLDAVTGVSFVGLAKWATD